MPIADPTFLRRTTWVDTGLAVSAVTAVFLAMIILITQPTFIHYEFELPFFAAPVKVDVVSRPSVVRTCSSHAIINY